MIHFHGISFLLQFKMKVLLIVAVISSFFLVATAQNCAQRLNDLSSCSVTQFATAGGDFAAAFCNSCGNTLVRYFQDCPSASGIGVDDVKQSE